MAISTYGTELKWGSTASNLSKKVPIKDFPDMMGTPNLISTTTLSDNQETNIPGIKTSETKTFTCNYTSADYAACQADAEKDLYYALEFSDGSKLTWQGQHTLGMPGKGVDEAVEFTINVTNSTPVTHTPVTSGNI